MDDKKKLFDDYAGGDAAKQTELEDEFL